MIGSTAEPTNGIPSLTDGEIYTLYQKYLHRDPDSGELASERENAMKYSAAGIERQISLRAGNAPNTGVRGDEGLPSLTVAAPPPVYDSHAGSVIAAGPAAIVNGPTPTGPTGLQTATMPAPYASPAYAGGQAPYYGASAASGGLFGMSMTTLLVLAAAAGAAWYFFVKK